MRIVICDDNIKDLIELEKLVLKYSACYPDRQFEVEKFSEGEVLQQEFQNKGQADIYILDIVMSGISGIDLGNQIRKNNQKSIIIYVTTSDDFALDAYDIHAIRYLLKPVKEEDFFEAMDYALTNIYVSEGAAFMVKTKTGILSVPYYRIEYIENVSRRLEVHLTDGQVITSIFIRKSFEEEIKEFVGDRNFLRVHKSFLVNMKYIKKLTRTEAAMESGNSIPISRKSALDVRREYLLYASAQYR